MPGSYFKRPRLASTSIHTFDDAITDAFLIPNAPVVKPYKCAIEVLVLITDCRDAMRKKREPLEFCGIFKVEASSLGMCLEESVFIGVDIVRFRFEILESLKPFNDFFCAENLH